MAVRVSDKKEFPTEEFQQRRERALAEAKAEGIMLLHNDAASIDTLELGTSHGPEIYKTIGERRREADDMALRAKDLSRKSAALLKEAISGKGPYN